MEEKKETAFTPEEFSLTPILDPETKEYSLLRFDEVKEACEGFIEENTIETITTEDDLKILKKCRTNLRKKKDTIKAVRLALVKLFSWQFKALEDMLSDADNKLKQLKEEFEASKTEFVEETAAPVENDLKEVTLVIKYRDVNVIEQIKKLAVDGGCTITEIKENK